MPKATDKITTKNDLPSKAEIIAANSDRYLQMESDIYEIGYMANATTIVLDEFMEEYHGLSDMDVSAKGMAEHLQHWRSAVDFMVHHLDQMAQALRKHYETSDEVVA